MLVSSGYNIQRWEQPLKDLAAQSNAQSVLILAEPMEIGTDDYKAVDAFLKRGGRVLVTGISGGNSFLMEQCSPQASFSRARAS